MSKIRFKFKQICKYLKNQVRGYLYSLKIIKRYSPYCPYCTSCGETGCCKPTICINHPKGHYCETNNNSLKVSYHTLHKFWNDLDEKQYPEVEKLLRDIYGEEYDKYHT